MVITGDNGQLQVEKKKSAEAENVQVQIERMERDNIAGVQRNQEHGEPEQDGNVKILQQPMNMEELKRILAEMPDSGDEKLKAVKEKKQYKYLDSMSLQKDDRKGILTKAQRKESVRDIETRDRNFRYVYTLRNVKNKSEEERKRAEEEKRKKTVDVMLAEKQRSHKLTGYQETRRDVSGMERRRRAANNRRFITVRNIRMEEDIDNLIENAKADLYLSGSVKISKELEPFFLVEKYFSNMFKAFDKKVQINLKKYKDRAKEAADRGGESESERAERVHAQRLYELNPKFQTFFRGYAQTTVQNDMANRTDKEAIELALKQLREDDEMLPSAYTKELIKKTEVRLEKAEKVLEDSRTRYKGVFTGETLGNEYSQKNEQLDKEYRLLAIAHLQIINELAALVREQDEMGMKVEESSPIWDQADAILNNMDKNLEAIWEKENRDQQNKH